MKKFLAWSLSDVEFIMLIKVKMPTIVGILTFMSKINFVLSWVTMGKVLWLRGLVYSEPLKLRTTFSGPIFLTKMLESNSLYGNFLVDIWSVWWHRKHIGITHTNHSAKSRQFWQKCTCSMNAYSFYLRFTLDIIHGDHSWQENTKKQSFYSSKTPFFRSLNLVTPLLFG